MLGSIRKKLGLSQQSLADWFGIDRTTLAQAESGRRPLPYVGQADSRLRLAAQGQVLNLDGAPLQTLPPLPPPPIDAKPLERRLRECRYHLLRLDLALDKMRGKAACYEARLVAAPALRAWTGPVQDPEMETPWLHVFEGKALRCLRTECGAGPQALLTAQIAGWEREAALLQETLDGLAPTP